MAANPYWTDSRLAAQQPVARAMTLPSPSQVASPDAVVSRPTARRRGLTVPSWVIFCTVMLATFAVCVTMTMRTHARMLSAEQEWGQMSTDVEKIRSQNESLRQEVHRLSSDPRAIESIARERMKMVRANEVVVPLP
jgi:cell division protein FtsB